MGLRFRIRPPGAAGAAGVERALELEPGGGEITVGRRGGVAMELPFPTVSALHARLVRQGDGWLLVDLGSANGTCIGERRLAAHAGQPLREGDVLRFADVTVVFDGEARAEAPAGGAESTATLARRLVSDLFGAARPAEVARLVVDGGPDDGRVLRLEIAERLYRVGRAGHCDLVLADEDVSREHAACERRWEGVFVRDLGSKNGIEVGGRRLAGAERVRDGDVLVLGGTRLRVDDPEERYLRQMRAAEEEAAKGSPTPGVAVEAEAAADAAVPDGPRRRTLPGTAVVAVTVLLIVAALVGWLLAGSGQ